MFFEYELHFFGHLVAEYVSFNLGLLDIVGQDEERHTACFFKPLASSVDWERFHSTAVYPTPSTLVQ